MNKPRNVNWRYKVRGGLFLVIFISLSACSTSSPKTPTSLPPTILPPIETSSPIPTNTSTREPTITNTPKPTFTLTPEPSKTITSTPIHPTGKLIFHKADDSIIYNWFSYVPSTLERSQKSYIWISGIHGNISTNNYDQITEESRKQAEWRMTLADQHKYVLLVPVIPRPQIKYDYPVSIPWYVFLKETDPFLQRPADKVNLMVDNLLSDLRKSGYNMNEKVYIDGFSAGAMFAQRYTLLYPKRVQAIAAGQCGGAITLPLEKFNDTPMNWPVGVNDFSQLVGYDFDEIYYKQIPQYIYIGDQDTKNSTVFWGPYANDYNETWRTPAQIYFLNNNFGNSDPIRLQKQVTYLQKMGFTNVTFKLYPGVGHQLTGEMLNDTFSFFTANQ